MPIDPEQTANHDTEGNGFLWIVALIAVLGFLGFGAMSNFGPPGPGHPQHTIAEGQTEPAPPAWTGFAQGTGRTNK